MKKGLEDFEELLPLTVYVPLITSDIPEKNPSEVGLKLISNLFEWPPLFLPLDVLFLQALYGVNYIVFYFQSVLKGASYMVHISYQCNVAYNAYQLLLLTIG